jgi:hypothetical protein
MLIKSFNRIIELSPSSCIKLEVQFNLSDKGHEWLSIGDALYSYSDISVTDTQFDFLRNLLVKHDIAFFLF